MAEAEAVTVGREEFGVAANNPVYLYWLRSPGGLAVAVSTWGASVVHVCAPTATARRPRSIPRRRL